MPRALPAPHQHAEFFFATYEGGEVALSGAAVLDASGEIYGDVANIAARVQALAEPGAVLVTAQVQRQVAGLFVAEERGTRELRACLSQ